MGLTGKAGCGKTTVAEALVKIGFAHWMFALPLKAGVAAMLGITCDQVQGSTPELRAAREEKLQGFDFSIRRALQVFGTEAGRSLDHDIWVKLADQELRRMEKAKDREYVGMVVSDVRFENEATWIRENGGEVWHIVRPGVEAVAEHASEAGVQRHCCDIELFNSGTVEGIQRAAQIIVRGE